jgi:hypothetical protein
MDMVHSLDTAIRDCSQYMITHQNWLDPNHPDAAIPAEEDSALIDALLAFSPGHSLEFNNARSEFKRLKKHRGPLLDWAIRMASLCVRLRERRILIACFLAVSFADEQDMREFWRSASVLYDATLRIGDNFVSITKELSAFMTNKTLEEFNTIISDPFYCKLSRFGFEAYESSSGFFYIHAVYTMKQP